MPFPVAIACGMALCDVAGWDVPEREWTQFREAISRGDVRSVDAFLNRRPRKLHAFVGREKSTPLQLAAGYGHARLAERLRARGAPVDIASAAKLGWDEEVRRIAKADPDALARRGGHGNPLQMAVWDRRVSTARLLIQLGSPLRLPATEHFNSWDIRQDMVALGPDFVEFILARSSDVDLKELWPEVFEQACRAPPAGQDEEATARTVRLLLARRPGGGAKWDASRFLRTACWAGNVPAVKLLLAAGADPVAPLPPDPERLSLTLQALFERMMGLKDSLRPPEAGPDDPPDLKRIEENALEVHLAAARLMPFLAGASVLKDGEGGEPPAIHLVAVSDHIRDDRVRREIADLLVRAGAPWTPSAAVALGRSDLVRQFVAADPELTKRAVYRVFTMPSGPRYRQRSCSLRPLPERDFNQREVFPLEAAAERGDLEVVRLLLPLEQPPARREAELSAVLAALRVAVERGHLAVVRAIVAEPRQAAAFKEDLSRVFEAAGRTGNVPVLEALAAERTATKAEASAALRASAANGHLAAAKRAYTLGGHVSVQARNGESALILAAGAGYVDVVRWLLAERADPDQTCQTGEGPLHRAAVRDFARTMEVLLAGKADPNLLGPGGQTPLMLAANTDAVAAIKALADGGADLRAKDSVGNSALHVAAASGSVRAARELLRLGADPSAKNTAGNTPLDLIGRYRQSKEYAKFERWDEIEALLRAAGPKK